MELRGWNDRLAAHFATLREHRCADGIVRPIFGLEHGLNPAEIEALEGAIRAYIVHARPTRDQALAWIVYSSELGYRYSGAEYWQTFEDETPGWTLNGDRYRIRHFYRQFQRDFGEPYRPGRGPNISPLFAGQLRTPSSLRTFNGNWRKFFMSRDTRFLETCLGRQNCSASSLPHEAGILPRVSEPSSGDWAFRSDRSRTSLSRSCGIDQPNTVCNA